MPIHCYLRTRVRGCDASYVKQSESDSPPLRISAIELSNGCSRLLTASCQDSLPWRRRRVPVFRVHLSKFKLSSQDLNLGPIKRLVGMPPTRRNAKRCDSRTAYTRSVMSPKIFVRLDTSQVRGHAAWCCSAPYCALGIQLLRPQAKRSHLEAAAH